MKFFNQIAFYALILSITCIGFIHSGEPQGIINPVVPKTVRLKGESKEEMIKRFREQENKRDPHEKRRAASENNAKHARKHAEKVGKQAIPAATDKQREDFKNFKGYWLLSSIDDWSSITVIQFFEDEQNRPMAKFFDGTQNYIRERNQNDVDNELVSPIAPSSVDTVIAVEVLGPKSIRFFNNEPILSKDDLTSTFRIQDKDHDLGYMYLWSTWDGTGDNPDYGVVETLTQYKRLPGRPNIQTNDTASKIDWNNPVEMFKYVVDYYTKLGQLQKAVEVHQTDYIGWSNFKELEQLLLTTGVTHTAKVSTAYRGGQYIGVWRTQFPDDFPITTIHTQELSHMNSCSKIHISGFSGAYAVLNGTHLAAAFPPASVSISTPYPWQDTSSREHFVHIQFDSSRIKEEYDPNIHGVADLVAHHGPITPDIGYREFMAAVQDFVQTSFGPGTHTRTRLWIDNESGITVPETFKQLKNRIANDSVHITTMRNRTYGDNGFQLYWNPAVLGIPLSFPAFNLNDPFGLGLAELDPYFDFDIVRQNYLKKDTVKNIFFTVTGPTDPDQPITSMLTDIGYSSNGTKVVFQANDYQKFPKPLVDEFGKHEWMQYNAAYATNSTGPDDYASQAFFGGIVNPELTGGQTVAYMRFTDESGFDEPFETLTVRSLAFPQEGISSTYLGNFIAAWAALIEELNKHEPDRFILDIRNNGGGFVINEAFGSLFGGERPSLRSALGFPGNGDKDPLIINGSGIQTVFNSVPKKKTFLLNQEAAAAFPNGVVRGSRNKPIEVIVLTSTRSASSGDVFPHVFLGPDPEGIVQDLGANVHARLVGDIDGRLWSGLKGYDGLPFDPLAPYFVDSDKVPRSALYLVADAGLFDLDRHGFYVNETLATRPNPLLLGWYDQTEWQDIGVTPNLVPYPLGDLKSKPKYNQRSTWRDVWLENAIVN